MERKQQEEVFRHGINMMKQGKLNSASRAFWRLLLLQENQGVRDRLLAQLLRCESKGGPLLLEETILDKQMKNDENASHEDVKVENVEMYKLLLHQLREIVSHKDHEPAAAVGETRRFVTFLDKSTMVVHKLPRFFSWVVPGYLAGVSTPRNRTDIQALEAMGVKLVVTVMEESKMNPTWFSTTDGTTTPKIRNVFYPVPNLKAPTVEEVDSFFKEVDDVTSSTTASERPPAIVVHCGGGVGRAGTFLACYLVRHGPTVARPFCEACKKTAARLKRAVRSADCTGDDGCPNAEPPKMNSTEAIALLRTGRPGSLETKWQEEFVKSYNALLWKRYSTPGVDDGGSLSGGEPMKDLPLSMTGKTVVPSFVVLVGLPGSGKSWFAEKLVEAGGGWMRASQDALGGDACRNMVSTNAKGLGKGKKLILDRCNPTAVERKEWLELAFKPKSAIAVYFDSDVEVCRERIKSRFGHETIRGGGGGFALTDMAKRMEPPTLGEGFCAIYCVHNFDNAKSLVEKWTGTAKGFETETAETLKTADSAEKTKSTKTVSSTSTSSTSQEKLHQMIKFPRTQHFFETGGKSVSDDDIVADATRAMKQLKSSDVKVQVEEKIDGANMGFRIDPSTNDIVAQNRTHFVNSKEQKQYGLLDRWIPDHKERLMHILQQGNSRKILFGEWMVAKHSIQYTWVPDYFLAFDILDVDEGKFYSRNRFNKALQEANALEVDNEIIYSIRSIDTGQDWASLNGKEDWKRVLMSTQSAYRDGPVEGLYIRMDEGDWLKDRMKLVRPDFVAGNEEFSKHKIIKNIVNPATYRDKSG